MVSTNSNIAEFHEYYYSNNGNVVIIVVYDNRMMNIDGNVLKIIPHNQQQVFFFSPSNAIGFWGFR